MKNKIKLKMKINGDCYYFSIYNWTFQIFSTHGYNIDINNSEYCIVLNHKKYLT